MNNEERYVRATNIRKIYDVSYVTLRRWAEDGKIRFKRTKGVILSERCCIGVITYFARDCTIMLKKKEWGSMRYRNITQVKHAVAAGVSIENWKEKNGLFVRIVIFLSLEITMEQGISFSWTCKTPLEMSREWLKSLHWDLVLVPSKPWTRMITLITFDQFLTSGMVNFRLLQLLSWECVIIPRHHSHQKNNL